MILNPAKSAKSGGKVVLAVPGGPAKRMARGEVLSPALSFSATCVKKALATSRPIISAND